MHNRKTWQVLNKLSSSVCCLHMCFCPTRATTHFQETPNCSFVLPSKTLQEVAPTIGFKFAHPFQLAKSLFSSRHSLSLGALCNVSSKKVLKVRAASARCSDVTGRCLLLLLVAHLILRLIPTHQSDGRSRLFFFLLKVLFFSLSPFIAFQ